MKKFIIWIIEHIETKKYDRFCNIANRLSITPRDFEQYIIDGKYGKIYLRLKGEPQCQ